MKQLSLLFACLLVGLCAFAQDLAPLPTQPSDVDLDAGIVLGGRQVFIRSDKLGSIGSAGALDLVSMLTSNAFGETDTALVTKRVLVDKNGDRHERIQQTVNGIPVVGSELIVHSRKNGDVYLINGMFAETETLAREASVPAQQALRRGMILANIRQGKLTSQPELSYILNGDGSAFLAWSALVSYKNADGDQLDRLFVDATHGEKVVRHPQYHYARNRKTYTGNNGTSLPGTLRRSEGQAAVGDAAVDAAHDNAGKTYDYYKARFNRDSYNGSGQTLSSTAHHQRNYNNAFWNGSQMVYGDGDGSTFTYFSKSLDVVAHELTHAVTEYESGLVYQNESGALNEALSDIFGVSATIYFDGGINSSTWLLGDDIYTPGTPGDALRYMNDPARAGDRDYYPDRYTGSNDNGGVHTNSGIANLAYVLLVQGGTHPRGKTSVNVPAIGLAQAEQIFYRAQTTYLGPNSNFQAARNATASAAQDLYGATAVDAVHKAWDAVGVPGGGGGGGGGNCSNGTTYNGSLSGTGSVQYQPNGTYYYSAASGSHVGVLNGTGPDFDLYLQKWNNAWANVAASEGSTSQESINYSGTAGYYTWRVYSYSGAGTYTLCLDHP